MTSADGAQVEEDTLAVETAAVAGEGSVGADYPLAGDGDRDRVATVGGADDPRSLPGLDIGVEEIEFNPRRLLAVAGGLPVGNLERHFAEGELSVKEYRERRAVLLERGDDS